MTKSDHFLLDHLHKFPAKLASSSTNWLPPHIYKVFQIENG